MIEKLERYDCIEDSINAEGDYVSYKVARAREDALLEALKPALSDSEPCREVNELWSDWQYRIAAWNKAVAAIRQIDE